MRPLIYAIIGAAICLLSILFFFVVSGLNWSQLICSADDPDNIACIREWINPVAALFTVVAIVYAALQVYEANRQSDAAVRGSLVQLRADTRRELENIEVALEVSRDLVQLASSLGNRIDVIAVRKLKEKADFHRSVDLTNIAGTIGEFLGSEATSINKLREDAIWQVRWLATLSENFGTYVEQMDTDNFQVYAQYGAENDVKQLISSNNAIALYRQRCAELHGLIVDAISDLDRDVLHQAEALRGRHLRARALETGQRLKSARRP